jgi:integrase
VVVDEDPPRKGVVSMARNGEWERVEPNLYRLKHQAPTGEWTTRYYVRFKDWKGINRKFPAGTDLRGARTKKKILLGENARRTDFDKEKTQNMTLARWGEIYLTTFAKEKKSVADDARHIQHLCRILGGTLLLSQITRAHTEQFKQTRKTETHSDKPISETTIDRSLEVLRHMLRIAEEERVIETVPRVKLYKPDNARDRALNEEEYQQLLAASSLHLQRIIICAYETGRRRGEIQSLTWNKVDLKAGLIRLESKDTKTGEGRPVPISATLRAVLDEIRYALREGKVSPIDGRVFTWKGKPMTEGWKTAFRAACRRARLADLHFHDLRHTFVTRKVREGWDYKRIMAITGHKTFAVFQRYNNPSEEDIKEVVLAEAPRKKVVG